MRKNTLVIGSLALVFLISGLFVYSFMPFTKQHDIPIPTLDALCDKENIVPILVLGSGCAGYAASIYGARGHQYTLVMAGKELGGQLSRTTYVDNWPSLFHKLGPDIMESLNDHAKKVGAHVLYDTAMSVDLSSWPYRIETENGQELYALTIIITTGASPRLLTIPGEQEYWGNGVTTCAICDAPFYKDKDVVVIGGGDSAAEEALQLASFARSITILVRKDYMRASAQMQKHLQESSNISIVYNAEVHEIIGDGDHVTAVKIFDNSTNQYTTRNVAGVFLAIGHEPNVELFKNSLDLDHNNYIITQGKSQKTNFPGVFAAGDVEDSVYRQAVVAAGRGVQAALDAHAFLRDLGFNEHRAQQYQDNYFKAHAPVKKKKIGSVQTQESFAHAIRSDSIVVIDFYTAYCPGCVRIVPMLEELAALYEGQVTIFKCDAGKLPEVAQQYGLDRVPLLIAFKNGQEFARYTEGADKQLVHQFFKTLES